jgi:hypothetical protein
MMSGTREGAAKAAKTNKEKYGPEFYKEIGSQSWKNPDRSRETGFALLPKETVVELGRRGGKKNKGKKYAKKVVYLTSEEAVEELKKAYPDFNKISSDLSE